MAGIKDILEIEGNRPTPDDWSKIHIFQEGSFYRAYEVSAWLCWQYLNKFKVTHRQLKGLSQTVVFVGFPVTSIQKWKPENAELQPVADKQLTISLHDVVIDDIDMFKAEYESWKMDQPLVESAQDTKKERHEQLRGNNSSPTSLFSIAQQILAYPIESKSPIESMLFLADLKQLVAQIV